MSETFTSSSSAAFGEGSTEMVFNPRPEDPPPGDPEFVVQIRDIRGDTPCLDDQTRATVLDAITTSFSAAACTRTSCAPAGPTGRSRQPRSGCGWSCRSTVRGVPPSPSRGVGGQGHRSRRNETIAFFLAAPLFTAAAAAPFPPNPDSSTHLHEPMRLELRAPDTIITLTIAIPAGLKIPVQYTLRPGHHDGVQVDDNGMYVGGFLLAPVPRQPAVTLVGKTNVVIRPIDGEVDDVIEAATTDMRGALQFSWTLNGRPHNTIGPTLTLSFGKSTGPFTPQTVAVTVTDADGLSAHDSIVVTASLQQTQGHDKGSRNKIQTA